MRWKKTDDNKNRMSWVKKVEVVIQKKFGGDYLVLVLENGVNTEVFVAKTKTKAMETASRIRRGL